LPFVDLILIYLLFFFFNSFLAIEPHKNYYKPTAKCLTIEWPLPPVDDESTWVVSLPVSRSVKSRNR
jgi:hypothetical protein